MRRRKTMIGGEYLNSTLCIHRTTVVVFFISTYVILLCSTAAEHNRSQPHNNQGKNIYYMLRAQYEHFRRFLDRKSVV